MIDGTTLANYFTERVVKGILVVGITLASISLGLAYYAGHLAKKEQIVDDTIAQMREVRILVNSMPDVDQIYIMDGTPGEIETIIAMHLHLCTKSKVSYMMAAVEVSIEAPEKWARAKLPMTIERECI